MEIDGLSKAIKALRLKTGETQTQFASRIGVSVSTLAHYEIGDQIPKATILKLLADLAATEKAKESEAVIREAFRDRINKKQSADDAKSEDAWTQIKALRQALERIATEEAKIVALYEKRLPKQPYLQEAIENLRSSIASRMESVKHIREIEEKAKGFRRLAQGAARRAKNK